MTIKSFLKFIYKYRHQAIAIVFSVYALCLRLLKLTNHTLWADELLQLRTLDKPFIKMIKSLPQIDFNSYLNGDHILIYPFFKIFSFNKWGLAIPHILVTILGFWFLYMISKRYFKTTWGYTITFCIICFNATLINHATEIRPYAVLPTLALGCFYFSEKLINQNVAMKIQKKMAIGIFFIATIWFHLYGIAITSAVILFYLLTKISDKNFKTIFKHSAKFYLIILFVTIPLWLISVFGAHPTYQPYGADTTFTWIADPSKNFVNFLKGVFGNLVGFKPLYPLLAGTFLPFLIPHENRLKQISLLFIMVFLPMGAILLADIKTTYPFIQRQFIWVMPFFALFLGWSWDSSIFYVNQRLSSKSSKTN